jgi:hypothetical protein
VSNQDKKQRKSQPDDLYAAEGIDTSTPREIAERLHPSLQESFVALPPAGIRLTPEQLEAVFGGDLRGLREMARLVFQPGESEPES